MTVSCGGGEKVLGGGGKMTTTDSADTIQISSSYPTDTNTWSVTGVGKVGPGKTWTVQAWAVCVPG